MYNTVCLRIDSLLIHRYASRQNQAALGGIGDYSIYSTKNLSIDIGFRIVDKIGLVGLSLSSADCRLWLLMVHGCQLQVVDRLC